jgi:hypothetical protein
MEAEQVPVSAGTPPDHPDCHTSTSQTESRCPSGVAKVAESVTRSDHFRPLSPAGLDFARYAELAWFWMDACGNTVSSCSRPMSTLTTSVPSTEVLEDALLTLDQISTRITVLALNASRNPEQSVKVRMLLGDLLADIQDCESELGTYGVC